MKLYLLEMFLKAIITRYNKYKAGGRLLFFAEKFKGNGINNEQFHKCINKEYYKYFSVLYKKRNTLNIERSLKLIIKKLKSSHFQNIYDIGSGEGFINKILRENDINYDRFYNCDPYQKPIVNDHKSKHLPLNFDESIKEIGTSNGLKLITLCSTVHHMINPYKEITSLVNCMKRGDLILIAHEPMNTFSSTISHILMKLISSFINFSFKNKHKSVKEKQNKYSQIISSLKQNRIISNSLTPLHIRRIVDYQVGYKLDYINLSIPIDMNEGYWSNIDTCKLLKRKNLKIVQLTKYPYISTKFRKSLGFINNLFYFFRLNTQYSVLAKKL